MAIKGKSICKAGERWDPSQGKCVPTGAPPRATLPRFKKGGEVGYYTTKSNNYKGAANIVTGR